MAFEPLIAMGSGLANTIELRPVPLIDLCRYAKMTNG